MAFFVEAGVVGEGKHFKLLVDGRMIDGEGSAGEENFLGKNGAGLGEIDEIYGVAQFLGELTGEVETSQRSNGGGGKEGDVDIALGVLRWSAERTEKVNYSGVKRGQGVEDAVGLIGGKVGVLSHGLKEALPGQHGREKGFTAKARRVPRVAEKRERSNAEGGEVSRVKNWGSG